MCELNFKKWLEVFGGSTPPVQRPDYLNNGAYPRYEIPESDPVMNLLLKKKKKKL